MSDSRRRWRNVWGRAGLSLGQQGGDDSTDDGDRRDRHDCLRGGFSQLVCFGLVTTRVGDCRQHNLNHRGERNAEEITKEPLGTLVRRGSKLCPSCKLDKLAYLAECRVTPELVRQTGAAHPSNVTCRGTLVERPLGELPAEVPSCRLRVGHRAPDQSYVESPSALGGVESWYRRQAEAPHPCGHLPRERHSLQTRTKGPSSPPLISCDSRVCLQSLQIFSNGTGPRGSSYLILSKRVVAI